MRNNPRIFTTTGTAVGQRHAPNGNPPLYATAARTTDRLTGRLAGMLLPSESHRQQIDIKGT